MSNLEKHLIDSIESKKLVEEYDKTIYPEMNKNRPSTKPESKSYNIDLEVLQEYLKMISAEMDKKGIVNKGVKITLGKYPEKSADPKLNPDFLGYQMAFISPLDLTQSAKNIVSSNDFSASKSLEDLPNLNYMGISPPN